MKNYSIVVIVAIIVGAVAFFGGMKYQESKSPATMEQGQFVQRMDGSAGGQKKMLGEPGTAMGATVGEIISVDDTSVTVKLEDGSSKIINLSETTAISKSATAVLTDLKAGEKIAAFGKTNSDGSISAQTVQLNPAVRIMDPEGSKEMMEKNN